VQHAPGGGAILQRQIDLHMGPSDSNRQVRSPARNVNALTRARLFRVAI
jgi:hypothetical protein